MIFLGSLVGVLAVLVVILLLVYAGLSVQIKALERNQKQLQVFAGLALLSDELGPVFQRAKAQFKNEDARAAGSETIQ
jgi:uncharacterized membrane protein